MVTNYQDVNIIKASYRLMQKVGIGPIDEDTIKECEAFIQDNNIDFLPWALSCLENLKQVLREAKNQTGEIDDKTREELIAPIMQLKASGTMFQNEPLTELALCMLHFLENVQQLDEDALEIIRANEAVLMAFLNDAEQKNVMTPTKEKLITELRAACNRYAAKNSLGRLF